MWIIHIYKNTWSYILLMQETPKPLENVNEFIQAKTADNWWAARSQVLCRLTGLQLLCI